MYHVNSDTTFSLQSGESRDASTVQVDIEEEGEVLPVTPK